jgi:hypothetical protein
MTPAQRLEKSFELTAYARSLFAAGLRQRHPDATEEEFRKILAGHLIRRHNRNY